MQIRTTQKLIAGIAGVSTILTGVLIHNNFVQAQNPSTKPKKFIVRLSSPVTRTQAQMRADSARAVRAATRTTLPFLPGMDPKTYEQLKAAAAQAPVSSRRQLSPTSSSSKPKPLASTGTSCEGNSQTEGLRPPDTHGAVGLTQFVEVTNSRISVFNKSNCSTAKSLTLASFFGYFTQGLFDPRVVYDSTWNRWIVVADAFEESSTIQRQFIAVSKTSDAAGDYYIYDLNVKFSFNNNAFWDYPQLGLDQNSVLITGRICPYYCGSSNLISIAKSRLYNGQGFYNGQTLAVPVFIIPQNVVAPPIVLDQSTSTFLVSAQPAGNSIQLYKLTNSSNAFEANLSAPAYVPVPYYSLPPSAVQPGTNARLDTLDARFVNASTQVGNSLWQVHTIEYGGLPTPKFYEINTSTNSLKQSGFFFAGGSSNDWNASIAANSKNDKVFVTWSSTNARGNNVQAQVRASACIASSCSFGSGLVLAESSTFYTQFRWGDYSAVTIDPTDNARAWIVNEKINDVNTWGSRFGRVDF